MRRPSVIYDLATAPSQFPYLLGKFDFLFYQCMKEIYGAEEGGRSIV
jgi:hypothetical protein